MDHVCFVISQLTWNFSLKVKNAGRSSFSYTKEMPAATQQESSTEDSEY